MTADLIALAAEGRIEVSQGGYEDAGYYIDCHDPMDADDTRRTRDLIERGQLHLGPRLGPCSLRRVIEAIPSGRCFLNDD